MIGAVRIERLPAERLVTVHASPVEALPLLAPFAALRLGPEEFLCLDATARAVSAALGAHALVLDIGDAFEGWRISGAGMRDLLMRACTLDVQRLQPGVATRTAIAGLPVVLRMLEESCELRLERSYGAWFEVWLRELAQSCNGGAVAARRHED